MTPESLKPDRIGTIPPAGDQKGRYEWMKRRHNPLNREAERRRKISIARRLKTAKPIPHTPIPDNLPELTAEEEAGLDRKALAKWNPEWGARA